MNEEEAKLSKKELDELLTYASGIGVSYEALTSTIHKENAEKGLLFMLYYH